MDQANVIVLTQCKTTKSQLKEALAASSNYIVHFLDGVNSLVSTLKNVRPRFVVVDADVDNSNGRGVLTEISRHSPLSKTILISEKDGLMQSEFFKSHAQDIVVKGDHIGKRVKIAVDQITFETMYGEDFSDDVLTIENKYASTGIFVTVLVLITISFVTLLVVNL